MTPALASTDCARQLNISTHEIRRVISGAGFGVPACSLRNRAIADWTREHGVTVTAHDDAELDFVQRNGIRPTQIVLRPTAGADTIRRAVNLGVSRFVIATSQHVARLAECAQRTKYIYLDSHSPLVLDEPRLEVVGLHGDVDDSGGAMEWATVAEQLLCRMALMKTVGSPAHRIVLTGGSTEMWMASPTDARAIVRAVDDALREGCERWHLSRPAVTVAPSQ